jgi:hypothetical protein
VPNTVNNPMRVKSGIRIIIAKPTHLKKSLIKYHGCSTSACTEYKIASLTENDLFIKIPLNTI